MYHAYKVLVDNGMDPERIILMSNDSVANTKFNADPKKQMYNQKNGQEIYPGSEAISFKGEDFNPKTFMRILKNQPLNQEGEVAIKTDKNSKIFIAFSGMTGPAMAAFPLNEDGNKTQILYADDLANTIRFM